MTVRYRSPRASSPRDPARYSRARIRQRGSPCAPLLRGNAGRNPAMMSSFPPMVHGGSAKDGLCGA
jgi:hypothetical protein